MNPAVKKINKKKMFSFFAILCGIFFALFCPAANAQISRKSDTIKIKLYFPPADWDFDKLIAVERRIPKTRRIADAALRELFKGVTEDERKRGIHSSYSVESSITGRDECRREIIKPLLDYYIGVSVKKGVATVNFRKPAGCYLDTAIAMASSVMNPIEATLKQFESIKEVQFALDGEVITEWDA